MYKKIVHLLQENKLHFTTYEHEHVHSSEDAAKVRGTSLEEAAKALVLMTGSGMLVLCMVAGHRKLDLKKVKELLDEKNVRLADPDLVFEVSGCKVGSVPPFGNLFDTPLPMYADDELFTREHIVFSAGSHYHSIRMKAEDWAAITKTEIVSIGTPKVE